MDRRNFLKKIVFGTAALAAGIGVASAATTAGAVGVGTITGRFSSKHANMQDWSNSPHNALAMRMYGRPYLKLMAEQRHMVKSWMFGLIYGGSVTRINDVTRKLEFGAPFQT